MAERIEIELVSRQGTPAPGQPGYAPPEPKPYTPPSPAAPPEPKPYTPPSPAAPPTQTQQAGAPEAPPQARQTAQEATPPEGTPAWPMYAPPAPTRDARDEQQGTPAFEIGPPVVIQAPPPPELPVPDARNDDGAYDRSLAEAWKMVGPEVPPPEPYRPPPMPEPQPPETPELPPPPRDEMADSYARAAEEARRQNAEDTRREKLLAEAVGPPPEEKDGKGKSGVDWFRAGQAVTSGAGQMAASAGGLDAGGVVQSGLGSASALAAAMGEPISAGVLQGMNMAFGGAKSFVDAMKGTADKLAQYSGPLAQAKGETEVMALLGDIKRANLAGQELAEMSVAYERASQEAQTALLELLKPVMPLVTAALQKTATTLEFAPDLIKSWVTNDTGGLVTNAAKLLAGWLEDRKAAGLDGYDTDPVVLADQFLRPLPPSAPAGAGYAPRPNIGG